MINETMMASHMVHRFLAERGVGTAVIFNGRPLCCEGF
jgi:hypothetical protein